MKRGTLLIFLLFFLFFTYPGKALADVINPSYFTARCNLGETEVECSWSRRSINGPVKSHCVKYENNPDYRFLEGTGSTFGGKKKYCFQAIATGSLVAFHIKLFLSLLATTLLIELPIFFIFGLRSKKAIFSVTMANLISVLLFYSSTIFLPLSGILVLIVMEFAVIVFETIVIKASLKEVGLGKIIASVLVANITSAIIGSFVLTLVQ